MVLVTLRRSTAERGGCFQQHLKLGGYVHSTKILLEFECQGQRSRSPGTKNEKVRHFVRESSSGGAVLI